MSDLISLPFPPEQPPQTEEGVVEIAAHLFRQVGKTKFIGETIRLFESIDEPWFMVEEIQLVLGFSASTKTILKGHPEKGHPENEKLKYLVDTSGQGRKMWFVNEPGLYRLIFKSRRPEAEALKTFIFGEVLPSLRRYGQYPPPKKLPAAEPLRLTPALEALIPEDARHLPLRLQMIIAERLWYVRAVELAPHPSLNKKIRHVCRHGLGRKRGWSWSSVYRHHRAYTRSGDWRCLTPHFENSGCRKPEISKAEGGR